MEEVNFITLNKTILRKQMHRANDQEGYAIYRKLKHENVSNIFFGVLFSYVGSFNKIPQFTT